MKTTPVITITRRNFLKTSAFATGSYLVLTRGTALANPGSSGISDGSFKRVTYRQFRLICVRHPSERIGQIAWLEAASAESLANPTACVVKVESEGPFRGQSFLSRRIRAGWTSNLTNFVSKSVAHQLKINGAIYDGRWIKDGNPIPEYEMTKENNSPEDLPYTKPEFAFNVDGTEVSAAVTKAGYFIGNLAVTGGKNIVNSSVYETSDGQTSATESGAEATLEVPDISAGVAVSPKSISLKNEIKNESAARIATNGSNVVQKQYSLHEGENGERQFRFDGGISSTMSARIDLDWKIIVQTKSKTVKTLDGREIETIEVTDWSPPLPPE